MSLCDEYCQTCKYYGRYLNNCDYILITKHSRGCEAGEGCTRREMGTRKMLQYRKYKKAEKELYAALGLTPKKPKKKKLTVVEQRYQLRRKLYDMGLTDMQIATYIESDISTVHYWRRKENLPPNPYSVHLEDIKI